MKSLILSLLFCSITFFSSAQDKRKNLENPSIDPEWHDIIRSYGFTYAKDMILDKYGNIYVAGYFSQALQVKNQHFSSSDLCSSEICNDYYVCKISNNGELIWLRQAIGDSRPISLALDKKNNLIVAGWVDYSDLYFTTTDTTLIKLDKKGTEKSGLFLCKYNPLGTVLKTQFYTYGEHNEVQDIAIDSKNNVYLTGAYMHSKNSELIRSYLMIKFNADWQIDWTIKGDTIKSPSQFLSLYIDKKNSIYATLQYSNAFSFNHVNYRKTVDPENLLVKLDGNGNVLWVKESIQGYQCQIRSVHSDAQKNMYTLSPGVNKLIISKLNPDGSFEWNKPISWNTNINLGGAEITDKNNLLLWGYLYGGTKLDSTDQFNLLLKSSGSTAFIAEYNLNGEIKWLQTAGTDGTHTFDAAGKYKDKIYTLISSNVEVKLKDTIIHSSGYDSWLAAFDYKKISAMDLKYMSYGELRDAEKYEALCSCPEQTGFNYRIRNLVPLSTLFEDKKEKFAIDGWRVIVHDHSDEGLFFDNLQASESTYFFDMVAFEPIRLIDSLNRFTINLTPCLSRDSTYEVSASWSYHDPLSEYNREFDHTSFDSTVQSYFDVLYFAYEKDTYSLLQNLLFPQSESDEEDDAVLYEAIRMLNKKYKLGIKEAYDENIIELIIEKLEAKNIDVNQVIVKDFILKGKPNRKLTRDDRYVLQTLFDYGCIENINSMLVPDINFGFYFAKMRVEIDTTIIRSWDSMKQVPLRENFNYVPVSILIDCPDLRVKNKGGGISSEIESVCMGAAEISGTSITMNFKRANLIGGGSKEEIQAKVPLLKYMQCCTVNVIDPPVINSKRTYYGQSEFKWNEALVNFSGLIADSVDFEIPYEDKRLRIKGKDVIINNDIIAGSFIVNLLQYDPEKSEGQEITIEIDGVVIKNTREKISEYFKNLGFDNVSIGIGSGNMSIQFVKYSAVAK